MAFNNWQIQTGDPTGTGAGGESYWGTPFRDEHDLKGAAKHDKRGVISMANKGANTNGLVSCLSAIWFLNWPASDMPVRPYHCVTISPGLVTNDHLDSSFLWLIHSGLNGSLRSSPPLTWIRNTPCLETWWEEMRCWTLWRNCR